MPELKTYIVTQTRRVEVSNARTLDELHDRGQTDEQIALLRAEEAFDLPSKTVRIIATSIEEKRP